MLSRDGQRTAALKDKLAALKHNVGRRPRKSATGDSGAAAGDASGDALSCWRQRRGRSDSPGSAGVDWDFIDAAVSREPGSPAALQRRNDAGEAHGRGEFEAAAVDRPSPTSQSGAGLAGSHGVGGDGHLGEGVGRDGRGGAGGGGGGEVPGSELSFEDRLARVLAASAAVLRKAQEREALPPGAPSPPREAQAALRDGRGAGAAGSPSRRGGAASPAGVDVDTIDDVLERWRRQRKAESASLGWAAPPSALAVLAAEQATAVAQQAVDTASASLKATPPRQRHDEPVAGLVAHSHNRAADGVFPSPEVSFDAEAVPRRTPPSARRALSLDGTQQQTSSPHSPPEAFGRPAEGSSPGAHRSQAEMLEDAVTAALSGLDHASPGAGTRHARSPVSLGYDLLGGDDMALLLQGTVDSMLFGEYAMPCAAATQSGTLTPPAARSPARRGGPPSPGVDAPADHGAPWQPVLASTPPRAAVPQSPVRTPSPVRLSPSVGPSSPGDEIVDHLKKRIAACRLELSQLGL